MSNITTNIKGIRDIMRKDTGVDGDAQRISQMVWMLFMKIFADKEEEWEITIDNYESPIPENLKWQNWAADDEGLTGDALMEFVNNELFPALKELDITISPQAQIIRSVFEDTYNYMIDPQLGESILDPACGTGGFLTCTIDHMREQVKTPKDRDVLQTSIRGIEKKPLPHLLCTTNLMLHGFDLPAVRRDNLLSKPYADWSAKDKLDIILTNPPFGGVEEDGTETNFPQKFRTKETADLFLALIIKLLKNNGRCAIVLPDGTLFGEGMKTRLKEELLERCNLHTIIRLPNGVFNPYTGIKTNLLFFEKGEPTKEVWYFEHPYPEGVVSYNKTKPINIKEFDLEKAWWNNREENTQAWKVSIEEIKKRGYNLDIKNPHQETDTLASPEVLLEKFRATEEKISSIQDEIINVLTEALK